MLFEDVLCQKLTGKEKPRAIHCKQATAYGVNHVGPSFNITQRDFNVTAIFVYASIRAAFVYHKHYLTIQFGMLGQVVLQLFWITIQVTLQNNRMQTGRTVHQQEHVEFLKTIVAIRT